MGSRSETDTELNVDQRRVVDSEILDSNVLTSNIHESSIQNATSLSIIISGLRGAQHDPSKIPEMVLELKKFFLLFYWKFYIFIFTNCC